MPAVTAKFFGTVALGYSCGAVALFTVFNKAAAAAYDYLDNLARASQIIPKLSEKTTVSEASYHLSYGDVVCGVLFVGSLIMLEVGVRGIFNIMSKKKKLELVCGGHPVVSEHHRNSDLGAHLGP